MDDSHADAGEAGLIVVLCTLPDAGSALRVARSLLEERLIACGSVLPGVTSVYRWEGATQETGEALLLIKTTEALQESLFARLGELHPYSVPEVISVRAAQVSDAYQQWVRGETSGT
jgi:periplasmic divalent cation tolerance protein